jgi:hypothetical protein
MAIIQSACSTISQAARQHLPSSRTARCSRSLPRPRGRLGWLSLGDAQWPQPNVAGGEPGRLVPRRRDSTGRCRCRYSWTCDYQALSVVRPTYRRSAANARPSEAREGSRPQQRLVGQPALDDSCCWGILNRRLSAAAEQLPNACLRVVEVAVPGSSWPRGFGVLCTLEGR